MKNKIRNIVGAFTLATLVGCGVQERTKNVEVTSQELASVDRYLLNKSEPERFDGFYSLGWTGETKIPKRYKEFAHNVEEVSRPYELGWTGN